MPWARMCVLLRATAEGGGCVGEQRRRVATAQAVGD